MKLIIDPQDKKKFKWGNRVNGWKIDFPLIKGMGDWQQMKPL